MYTQYVLENRVFVHVKTLLFSYFLPVYHVDFLQFGLEKYDKISEQSIVP